MTAAPRDFRVEAHDLRTVRIDLGSARLLLRYGFVFDGHERLPESVSVAGTEVTAFFLSSTVRDRITPSTSGLTVTRRWTVLQSGKLRLVLTVDLPELVGGARRKGGRPQPPRVFRYLFPGVASGQAVGGEPRMYRGERTCIPACVALASEDLGVCAFAGPPGDGVGVSVGVERATDDSGGLVRLRFETPAREHPAEAGFRDAAGALGLTDGSEEEAECVDRFERELAVHLVVGPPDTVYETALAGALGGESERASTRRWALREEVRSFLASHEVDQGGVCGVRVLRGAGVLSASAGAELSVLLCRLHPRDAEMTERAMRIADFVLRAQHPAGPFYERYSLRHGTWVGLRGVAPGRGRRPPLVSMEESSRIAASLLDLADVLSGLGIRSRRYEAAARRMVDAAFDPRGRLTPPGAVVTADGSAVAEEGPGELAFLHPLLRMADRDRRERYRKAAAQLAARWLRVSGMPLDLPSSRSGREPDSKAAFLLLEACREVTARDRTVPGVASLVACMLPWLYLGSSVGRDRGSGPGWVVDSFARKRLKPRPAEIAYLCHHFARTAKPPRRELLERIARGAAEAAGALPLGCAFVVRSSWAGAREKPPRAARFRLPADAGTVEGFEIGPVDARDFVSELGYCVRLEEEGLW